MRIRCQYLDKEVDGLTILTVSLCCIFEQGTLPAFVCHCDSQIF